MTCDIGSTLRSGCNSIAGFGVLKSILTSTAMTALLICFIIVFLLMVLIPVKSKTPGWLLFKFMFYSYMAVFGILVLHNGSLKLKNDEMNNSKIPENLLNTLTGGGEYHMDAMEVKPAIDDDIFKTYDIQ